MFQAQRIADGKCRPVILHGYGGAKKEMPDGLAALAKFGWIPMAAAMVGTVIPAVMDRTRLATHTWYLGGHHNPAASFVQQGKLTPAQPVDSHPT